MSLNTPKTSCRVIEVSTQIRRFLHKRNLRGSVSGVYCFSPKVNKSGIPSIQIPLINKYSEIKDYLNTVFCKDRIFEYKERYIFLSCIYKFLKAEKLLVNLSLRKQLQIRLEKIIYW